jgi:hypothetical protein
MKDSQTFRRIVKYRRWIRVPFIARWTGKDQEEKHPRIYIGIMGIAVNDMIRPCAWEIGREFVMGKAQ